ncbi:MAG TPA: ABC transporter substrate-binding protein [Dehalococcoidia bacterium]|nr:ABC transporter substrate-binding protein [Dehalococcoidia bacterium]
MQDNSYWSQALRRRISRRRALASSAAVGAAAAFLAACGGGGDEGEEGGGAGLLVQAKDRSKEAKRGGTLSHTTLPLNSLDVIGSTATLTRISASMLYNRLIRVLPGVNEPASGEKVGDAAESWELSPDRTRLTFKIRQNLGSDPRPPLNGRNLDAEDALSSWNRWAEKSPLRGDLLNSVNPDAPVVKVSAPDKTSLVFELAFPSTILMDYLADGFYFWVMPKEANQGTFDPNIEAHGAGPYYASDFLEGAYLKHVRNDNYYEKPIPYFDKMDFFIIPETAAQLAQFEAKALDLGAGTTNETIVDVKKRHPEMVLWQLPITNVAQTSRFGFAEGSPFRDERVRQAISMAYDRDALAEAFLSKSKLEAQGLPIKVLWASHISAMWEFSGDPKDEKSFGPNAKYFQYNIAEAKKLLEAAGKLNMEIEYHMDNFSQTNLQDAELLAGQLRDSGLVKVNQKVEEYASWFLPRIYRGRGDWDGMAHGAVGYKFSPEVFIYSYFHTGPGTAHYPKGMFPDLVDRATALTKEFDDKRRLELVKEFEKEAAKQMPCLPLGSNGGPSFNIAWPWVVQAPVLNQWPGDGVAVRNVMYSRYWFDPEIAKQYGKS